MSFQLFGAYGGVDRLSRECKKLTFESVGSYTSANM